MRKKRKWNITLRGVEPVIEIYSINKDTSVYCKLYLFYPFRKIKNFFYNQKIKKHFKNISMPIYECEGCGTGIVEWVIKDPNNPKVDLFVCQHCVGYYDVYLTKRRLETQHMMTKNVRGENEYLSRNRPRT